MPTDIGQIPVYAGNPKTLVLVFQDQDYSTKTFRSQLRNSPNDDALLVEWAITAATVAGTTTLTMKLTGDSVFGQRDGQTRKLGNKAVFDLERIDTATNVPEETMITGTVLVTQDVTR